MLSLVAVVGFGLRYRRHGRDLDSWLTLALTLVVFADLHYVLAPLRSSDYVLPSDVLRLLAFAVLLAGVWRAIGQAEFGRAVAEERARVARDIHDGLAQYLFAISAQISMLESGGELETILPRLKFASTAAQQEAQFAVLALSSASGSAPFDAALRRYVDFLVADGELDVEMEVDPAVTLGPDEEIEVFRIVQEGLANVAQARGRHGTRRCRSCSATAVASSCVSDDGTGIDDGRARRRPGPEEHALARGVDRGRAVAALVAREGDVDRGRAAAGLACLIEAFTVFHSRSVRSSRLVAMSSTRRHLDRPRPRVPIAANAVAAEWAVALASDAVAVGCGRAIALDLPDRWRGRATRGSIGARAKAPEPRVDVVREARRPAVGRARGSPTRATGNARR